MTLLNTVCNLGGNWPNTVVLWLVDVLTWRECVDYGKSVDIKNSTETIFNETNTCINKLEQDVSTIFICSKKLSGLKY